MQLQGLTKGYIDFRKDVNTRIFRLAHCSRYPTYRQRKLQKNLGWQTSAYEFRISHTDKDDHKKATSSTKNNGEINVECGPKGQSPKPGQGAEQVQDVINKAARLRWQWTEHVARTTHGKCSQKLLKLRPRADKRNVESPTTLYRKRID